MRKLIPLLLASAAVLSATSGMAADLVIAPTPDVVYDSRPVGDWAGFYVGGHVGYGWGLADHSSLVPGNDLNLAGWLVGAQAGANFYLTDAIVAGIVGDLDWANLSGSDTFGVGDITHSIDWMGSIRGKLGFDGGQFMPYVTAGLAFAQGTRDVTTNPTPAVSATHVGWTAGAGVDFKVMDDLSLNLEYRYSDLGSQTYDTGGIPPTIHLTSHAVRAGFNFHF